MTIGEAAVHTVGTTGQGIVKGGKGGSKVGSFAGMLAGGVGAVIPGIAIGGLFGGAWAASAAIAGAAVVAAPAMAAGVIAAAVVVGIGAIVGGLGGGLGGGWLGASVGGAVGFVGGLFKGGKTLHDKTPKQQLQDLRTMSAASDGQVAQAEAYLLQQREQQAAMANIKQMRADSSQSVANPDASDRNVAKVTSQGADRSTTLTV